MNDTPEGPATVPGKRVLKPWELAARRRNARLCTGPKTAAGKLRSSLNALRHSLYPAAPRLIFPEALFEDPRFQSLQRDLLCLLRPVGTPAADLLTYMTFGWWRKAVALGGGETYGMAIPSAADVNASLDVLLQQYVHVMRLRRLNWYQRLKRTLGGGLGRPADLRQSIENRLGVLGRKTAGLGASPEQVEAAQRLQTGLDALRATIQGALGGEATAGRRKKRN